MTRRVNREPWPDLYTQGCGCSADNAARGLDIFRASDAQESQSCSESAPGFQILRKSAMYEGRSRPPRQWWKTFYILSHRTISPWLDRHHVRFSLADTIVNHLTFPSWFILSWQVPCSLEMSYFSTIARGDLSNAKQQSRLSMLFIRFMCTRVL